MTSAALPHDPALPQLRLALDAAHMAGVFSRLLHGTSGAALLGCRVDRIKYRPRRNVAVSYLLDLQDAQGAFCQRVATRFCAGGAAAARHAKAAQQAMQVSRAGPALCHVPALDMLAHWWPNDAKLAAGAVLADAAALQQRWLPAVLRAAGAGRCVGHEVELVQVVPEHRVTARVQLHTEGTAGAAPLTVYAKADCDQRGARTQAVMHSLWHSPARRSGRLAVPRPLLWQPGSGLHWQAAAPGQPLLDVVASAGMAPCAEQIGALVAALHASAAPAAPLQERAQLERRLGEVVAVLSLVQPELAPRLQGLASALAGGLADLAGAAAAACTLHGDLHPRNLLALAEPGGWRLCLIDLDSARRGPAVLDLGAWLADVLYRARLMDQGAAQAEAAGAAFLKGYTGAGGQVCQPAQLAWATAWQLLCQRAWRCAVNLKPGRFLLLAGLVGQAESLLAQAGLAPAWAAGQEAL